MARPAVQAAVAVVIAASLGVAACSSDDGGSDAGDAAIASDAGGGEPAEGNGGGDGVADDGTPQPARTADALGEIDAPAGLQPNGFATATVRVTADDGEVCEVCVWLAATEADRARGLMGVTDLGEPVGMLFRFDAPLNGRFFMFGTPMPLSIAWFGTDGAHVGQTDMTPCLTDDSTECERYGPDADYLYALEMVQGELDVIGVGPGSTLEVLAEHDRCP